MIIGILKEIKNNENRIALIPEKAKLLTAKNHQVLVEFDAGIGSGYTNQDY
ncbi:MAG: alanine dehydrogenase, partial [Chloroflexi bacterium]|nr:alanine dehydrogenase [Chloroflexota bacterium]